MTIGGRDGGAGIVPDGDLRALRHGVGIEADRLGSRDGHEGKCGNERTYCQLFHNAFSVAGALHRRRL